MALVVMLCHWHGIGIGSRPSGQRWGVACALQHTRRARRRLDCRAYRFVRRLVALGWSLYILRPPRDRTSRFCCFFADPGARGVCRFRCASLTLFGARGGYAARLQCTMDGAIMIDVSRVCVIAAAVNIGTHLIPHTPHPTSSMARYSCTVHNASPRHRPTRYGYHPTGKITHEIHSHDQVVTCDRPPAITRLRQSFPHATTHCIADS